MVAAMAFAGSASAKLTPAEQQWVVPLVRIWNVQNAGLHLVFKQATAKNALVPGEKPENLQLTTTLTALVNCKVPADLIQKAGLPPTNRLHPFRDALDAACIHDAKGATDFAKAIGAIGKGQKAKAKMLLTQGAAEFRKGSTQIQKAYKALTALNPGSAAGSGLKA